MTIRQASLDSWLQSGRHKTNDSHQTTTNNEVDMQSTYNNYSTHSNATEPYSSRTRNSRSANLIQQSLVPRERNNVSFDHPWGHSMPIKTETHFRLGFRNINTLPIQATNVKNDLLVQDIRENDFDLFGISETNIAWQNLPVRDRIHDRFCGKFEFSKFVSSNNKDTSFQEKQQSGGTLIICHGHTCARVMEWGTDKSVLGRWSWIRLRGSNGRTFRFATVYRPVTSNGAASAYQQHRQILLEQGIDTCPRKQLLTDLQEAISEWIATGDQIVVAGDFNEDVRDHPIRPMFDKFNMHELILAQHGNNAPNTFRNGSTPIDAIFGTKGIDIISGGYTSGRWGTPSDHRALWVDIDIYSTFGGLSPPLWKPRMRRLKLEDPVTVNKFIQLRTKHMDKHQLLQLRDQITQVRASGEETWIEMLELLDRLRVQGILEADRRCRKLRCGNIPWSPELKQCMDSIGYLQICKSKYVHGKQVNSRTLMSSFQKTDLISPVTDGTAAILLLKQTYNEFNLLKSKASHLRGNFLSELANRKAADGDGKAEIILKQLILREEQRSVAQATKRVLRSFRSGVTAVEYRDSQGQWLVSTDKQVIEHECIQENISRFTQATHLPIMQHQQTQAFGWFAETDLSNQILQGTYHPDTINVDPSVHSIIPFLAKPSGVSDIQSTITTEQYTHEWKKGREFTATGLSGIHFGHFKASCKDMYLLELDRWMAEVSLQTGYSLNRWKRGIDVMIPKKTNSLRADQLRTIVLLEADFNFLNKIMGKRIMQNAEQAKSVAREQFGSRKAKGAINHAVNKQLALDIMRQEKRNFTLVILDAKGCYDRIAPPFASLALKRQGTPESYVVLLFSTIKEMQHFVRTAYGDSKDFYQQEDIPFHGILQGNGAGPTIWAMVSTPLLDRMRAAGHGLHIETPTGIVQIPAFAFVDDTDLVQDNEGDNNIESTQQAVSDWEESLRATGGLLVPAKCKFFVVRHKWVSNNWIIEDKIDSDINLEILDDAGQSHSIQQVSATSSELALGIMFSPSGNMEAETAYLRDKANVWAEKARTGHLTHAEAWYALQSTVLRAIEYALPATTLTLQQANSIIQPVFEIGLPRSGICRKISRDIVFAPLKYQGFGVRHPYLGQGISKIQLLFDVRQDLCQDLIDTSWNRTMVESGFGTNFLTKDFQWIQPVVTAGWITSLWEFLSSCNISVRRMDNFPSIHHIQRHSHDSLTMDAVAATCLDIPKRDRIMFNTCRLYLQVTRLSDISTADGVGIRRHIWNGDKQLTGASPTGWWPKQPSPSGQAWKIWQKILMTTFHTNQSGRFQERFPKTNPSVGWTWFLDASTDRLYKHSGGEWCEFSVLLGSRSTRNRVFGNPRGCSKPNGTLTAVTVYLSRGGFAIDGQGTNCTERSISRQQPEQWSHFISVNAVGNIEEIRSVALLGHELFLVSDGSAKNGLAASAWVLSNDTLFSDGIYISGTAKVPGIASDSHRAECFGICGGLLLVIQLSQQWNIDISTMNITVGCDNISALEYSFRSDRQRIGANHPDFDILQSTRNLILTHGLHHVRWRHVKGHQSGPDIDCWARLNNLADHVAGKTREATDIRCPPQDIPLSLEKWQVHGFEGKITKDLTQQLHDHCTRQAVRNVWNRYRRVKFDSFEKVDWVAMAQAMKESSIKERHWISKRAARDCGSNYVRMKRKERATDKCPFCDHSETVVHVMTCQSEAQTNLWRQEVLAFREWLVTQSTDPDITNSLIQGLELWRVSPLEDLIDSDDLLINQQSAIGWNGLLEGCLGAHWRIRQDEYFKRCNSCRSGNRWMVALIRRIWKIPWALWNSRNQKEHEKDAAAALERLKVSINLEVDKGDRGIPELVMWFTESELEKVSPVRDQTYAQAWLRNVRAGRRRDVIRKGSASEVRRMQALLRNYFR